MTPHNVENYTIGKGILYIAEWNGDTPPALVDTDLGNAPSAEVEPAVERLPHFSSRTGFRNKDKSPVIEVMYTVNFELDEPAAYNMQLFIMGSTTGNVVHGLTSVDKEYALKFVEDNPAGPNKTYEFWRGTLSPNGPSQLISDEWIALSYTFEGLSDTVNHATSPYFDITYETTTTTTTTTTTV